MKRISLLFIIMFMFSHCLCMKRVVSKRCNKEKKAGKQIKEITKDILRDIEKNDDVYCVELLSRLLAYGEKKQNEIKEVAYPSKDFKKLGNQWRCYSRMIEDLYCALTDTTKNLLPKNCSKRIQARDILSRVWLIKSMRVTDLNKDYNELWKKRLAEKLDVWLFCGKESSD